MDTDSLTEQTNVFTSAESACAVRLGPAAVSLHFAFTNSVENENKCLARSCLSAGNVVARPSACRAS